MPELEMDALFEGRLSQRLSDFADQAVRPFDAVEITRIAAADAGRATFKRPALPRGWRPLLAMALLALGLIGVGILGGFIKLPNNSIVPNPSFSPFSPMPVATTPLETPDSTASPLETPGTSPSGLVTFPPIATPTPQPTPSGSPTPSPTASPTPSPTPSPDPATVPVNSVVAVTSGDTHACALADDGRVFCWGINDEGQLGDGTTDYRDFGTVPVIGIDNARAIAAGIRFSCAALVDGTVWCWGEDPGSDGSSTVPVQVPGMNDATAITAGGAFACALRSNGQIGCWGNGQAGQLGNGVYENNSGVPTPQRVIGIDNAIAVSAGWGHACALLADRTVECWGANGDGASVYGSLGDGTSDVRRATPAPVVGLDNVASIATGGWSSCATRLDGTVWCWGYGQTGELGDGNFSNSSVPIQVALIDDAHLLALGDHNACVSRSDNSVWCWGDTSWAGQDNPGNETPGTPRQGNKSRPRVVTALVSDKPVWIIDSSGQTWWWGTGTNQAPELWPVGP